MLLFLNLFKKKKEIIHNTAVSNPNPPKDMEGVAVRKGEIGEYKIDIQLAQLPKEYRHLRDLLIPNPKAKSGYSQIDHVVITPYGIFTIETKNYQGTIYGGKDRQTWLVNGKFKMMNPFVQNYGHIQALSSLIEQKYRDTFISMVSFTKRCTFKVGEDYRKMTSDELIMYDIEFSEFIHRKVSVLKLQHKEERLCPQEIERIHQVFIDYNITDPKLRTEHVNLLKPKVIAESESSVCVTCGKAVSEKVKQYCLQNKRFKGDIYCFDHQKMK